MSERRSSRHVEVADHPAHSRSVSGLVLDDLAVFLAGHHAAQEHLPGRINGQLEIPLDRGRSCL